MSRVCGNRGADLGKTPSPHAGRYHSLPPFFFAEPGLNTRLRTPFLQLRSLNGDSDSSPRPECQSR